MPKHFAPALIYGIEGKHDQSFNAAAYAGAERFKKEFGVDYVDTQNVIHEAQREQILRNLARKGRNPIVSITYSFENAVKLIAKEFPNTKFIIFGTTIEGPNIQSIHFRFEEASFLVGMAAALATKTGKVGTITAVDIPIMRSFDCGFAQGAKYVDKNVTIVANTIGITVDAFNDASRGAEIAKSQFHRGVDVVFPAAGAAGLGVLQAAADADKLGVGYCADQNHLHPNNVLASMIECADVVVYNTFRDVMQGHWKPGIKWLGLKENGVAWAPNNALLLPDAESKINAAKADIISGKLKVVDYRANNSCPVQ